MMEPVRSRRAWPAFCATGVGTALGRRGPGIAVMASASVPGLVTPTRIGGREYVDGGVTSPVPLRVARALLSIWTALGISTGVAAGEQLRVSAAWVPPTVPGQTVGAAYMQLRSVQDAALVKVEADVAATAEIHQMTTVNDVMRMRKLDQMKLPAGLTVELSPGATHLMLVDLRQPLKVGDSVKLTLTLRLGNGRTLHETIVAPVVQKATHGGH